MESFFPDIIDKKLFDFIVKFAMKEEEYDKITTKNSNFIRNHLNSARLSVNCLGEGDNGRLS